MTRDQELNYINRKADDLEREVHALGLENERLKEELDETIEAIKEGDKENERLKETFQIENDRLHSDKRDALDKAEQLQADKESLLREIETLKAKLNDDNKTQYEN